MSADTSSQDAAEHAAKKAQEASEGAKESVSMAVHDADRAARAGVERSTDLAADVRDAANEKLHRGAAEAEHTRREVAGDQLTVSERLASVANEVKSNAQADVDALKQRARKS